MPFVADDSFDAVAFMQAAARYARSKGCRDEDLASEMVVEALTQKSKRPGITLSMNLIWLKAYDTLHPRGGDGAGGRERRDALEHTVCDVTVMPDGSEVSKTACAVLDFSAHYAPATTNNMSGVVRLATRDLRRARYLARMPFGHLPFVL